MLSLNDIVIATKGKKLNGNDDTVIYNYCIDSRSAQSKDFFIPIVGAKSDGHNYIIDCVKKGIVGFFIEETNKNKENIINISKQINKDICIIEVENSENALYEIGKYNRAKHIDIPVVAITGSVGKTSTREMVTNILSKEYNVLSTYKNYNSYIGLSLMLLKLDNQDIAILEHGIDNKNDMERLVNASKPDIAVVTNIGTAHIGILGSQENIYKEKLQIVKNMSNKQQLLLNDDDKFLKRFQNENLKIIKYNLNNAKDVEINEEGTNFTTKIYDEEYKVKVNSIGQHNIYNTLVGIRIAEIFKMKAQNILKGIEYYKNLPGRFERIKLDNNVEIIDDTYNASLDSIKSGIQAIMKIKANRRIVVLGDMAELGEYTKELHKETGKIFKDYQIDILLTLGESSKELAKEAKIYLKEVNMFEDREKLIKYIKTNIEEGDLIYFKAANAMRFNEILKEVVKK